MKDDMDVLHADGLMTFWSGFNRRMTVDCDIWRRFMIKILVGHGVWNKMRIILTSTIPEAHDRGWEPNLKVPFPHLRFFHFNHISFCRIDT